MPPQNPITAIILAGGRGTRLSPVVSDRPKVLAEVSGRPFLAFLLDHLVANGVHRIVISTGYMADAVQRAFGSSHQNIPIVYAPETRPLGTGGGLRLAVDHVQTDPLLVLNGDSFCAFDLSGFLASHQSHRAWAFPLLLANVPDTARFGSVRIDAAGEIKSFQEKSAASGAGLINAGVYLISRRFALGIPPNTAISLEKRIFPHWIGKRFFRIPFTGPFIDIGTPESYRSAEAFFAG